MKEPSDAAREYARQFTEPQFLDMHDHFDAGAAYERERILKAAIAASDSGNEHGVIFVSRLRGIIEGGE